MLTLTRDCTCLLDQWPVFLINKTFSHVKCIWKLKLNLIHINERFKVFIWIGICDYNMVGVGRMWFWLIIVIAQVFTWCSAARHQWKSNNLLNYLTASWSPRSYQEKKKVWEKFLEKYQLGFGYKNDLELE